MSDLLDRHAGRVADAVNAVDPLLVVGWLCVLTGSGLIAASIVGGVAVCVWKDIL